MDELCTEKRGEQGEDTIKRRRGNEKREHKFGICYHGRIRNRWPEIGVADDPNGIHT